MKEGGKKLAGVKNALKKAVGVGVKASEIDDLAEKLIKKEGGKPSFKMVPGYCWATCVNLNEGVVHGIPKPEIVFKDGDIVSLDVGMFYKGFHTDTSTTVLVGKDKDKERFLEIGRRALRKAIKEAKPGRRIADISARIEETLVAADLTPIRALVGHGIGRDLHEDPHIPCFVQGSRESSPIIPEGATFAIEVMYTKGTPDIYVDRADQWTIRTRDGKIASLFEETVAVVADGPIVLTELTKD